MASPVVMPANNVDTAEVLHREFPGRIATLLAPGGFKSAPTSVPYALDNGRFAVWSSGKKWEVKRFRDHLAMARDVGYDPLWLVVPDVVGDAKGTFDEWHVWSGRLKGYGWNLALAVQDGMTVEDVQQVDPQPDVIFVGGTTKWKWRYAADWCRCFPRVHIGRVATVRRLWMAHRLGAESSDSNVWRSIGQHLSLLRSYLVQSGSTESRTGAGKGFGL